jgi:transcriptional regulator with GAF, ATPase, and Fis domain
MPPVWYHFFGVDGSRAVGPFHEALAGAGFKLVPHDPQDIHGFGVVFFSEPTEEVCEFLVRASRRGLYRVVAIGAGHAATPEDAWRLLRSGASDVLVAKDAAPTYTVARFQRWSEIDRLVGSPLVQNNLIGRSFAWTSVLRQLVEGASYTDAPILILGETGTGKELAARLIHSLDQRKPKKELVVVDCGTIAPELSGSEFFGHERGSFTGAVSSREGAFELAEGGTLFVDEIGDLPLALQPELLRAVQEHTFKRLGSNRWQQTNFRLVSATNRNLSDEVSQGRFRRDLYYRIASLTVTLPPLRDRPEDVLPLTRYFIQQIRPEQPPPEIDGVVATYLLRRAYPGNVRDLRQLVGRIMYRHVGNGPITAGDVPEDERPDYGGDSDWRDTAFERSIRRAVALGTELRDIGHSATDTAISIAVELEGSVHAAAQRLGVTDRTLQIRRAAQRHPRSAGGSN